MTTIAFDGRFVAADSLSISGGRKRIGDKPKLRIKGDRVYGTFGVYGLMDAWIDWYEHGRDPEKTPKHGDSSNDIGGFLVFEGGQCIVYSHVVPYPVAEPAPAAFGSGREFAVGAMRAGVNAIRAVEIATEEDHGSGGPVQVIDLQGCEVLGHDVVLNLSPTSRGDSKGCAAGAAKQP